MNKKQYQQPTLHIVNVKIENLMAHPTSRTATTVGGNVFNSNITGGNVAARGRDFDGWDDDDE
ncbi:MAG: hypothetical protein K6B13_11765 [Prevotella sp.]|nr:hypothetical protein [Prevotella sp.]